MRSTRVKRTEKHANSVYEWLGIKNKTYGRAIIASLVTIFIVGLFSVFVRAPFSWYDEQAHYTKAAAYSNLHISRTSGKISTNQEAFAHRGITNILLSLEDKTDKVISWNWTSDYQDLPYTSEKLLSAVPSGAGIYTPFVYFPQIIVGWVNKLFKLNVVTEFLLMRLAGFIVSFILLVLAIKITPIGKFAIAGLMLLPTMIVSMTAISADTLSNVMILLFLAYFMKLYVQLTQDKAISSKEWLKFIVISAMIVLCKIPSFIVLGLYLPLVYTGYKRKQMTSRQMIILLSLLGVFALFTVVWAVLVTRSNTFATGTVDASRQIQFILADLPRALDVFFKNIFQFNILAIQLGYNDINNYQNMPIIFSVIYFCALTYSCSLEDDNDMFITSTMETKWIACFKVLMFVFVVLFSFYTMYTQFSQVGSGVIDGVQPRYIYSFIPLLFPATKLYKSDLSKIIPTWLLLVLPLAYYIAVTLIQL